MTDIVKWLYLKQCDIQHANFDGAFNVEHATIYDLQRRYFLLHDRQTDRQTRSRSRNTLVALLQIVILTL